MLRDLVVHGLGVIERAELTLADGCSVLTGETGAGKTMIVQALSLLLGGRGDRALVRTGARESLVDGRFTVPRSHPAAQLLIDRDVVDQGPDEIEFVVSRSIAADGRSKARVNGRPVPISLLQEVAGSLVEIASQHEHRALTIASTQRRMLDAFARADADAAEVAELVGTLKAARKELAEWSIKEGDRMREMDVLRFEIGEIESARLDVGEKEELKRRIVRLENAAELTKSLTTAQSVLKGEGGAIESLDRAAKALESIGFDDAALRNLVERLESAKLEVADVAESLAPPDDDPQGANVDDLRERVSQISRLERKYGTDEADVLAHLERSLKKLGELENFDTRRDELTRRAEELQAAALKAAERLSEKRRRGARALETSIAKTLESLAMPDARMIVALEAVDLYEGGKEKVTFEAVLNPGDAPRPIAKAASGGELSRIALALRVATTDDVRTFVFDEVDAGVGGGAARAVGRHLADLASRPDTQVLVVTHLPQIAAHADAHFRIDKEVGSQSTRATVERVDAARRVEELSRMLSGTPDSTKAKEHAQELLDAAASG